MLLFYRELSELQYYLIQLTCRLQPISVQCIESVIYEIFPIKESEVKIKLQQYLQKISKLYVADGHHRIQSLSKVRSLSRATFSQLYMSFIVQENELELKSFNRFIQSNICSKILISSLDKDYFINKVNEKNLDLRSNIYMYLNSEWYELNLKPRAKFRKTEQLPVIHIDKSIISLITKYSSRPHNILYFPGTENVSTIVQFYKEHQCQLAIHVPKLSFFDLFDITEKRQVLPPHSTYFTPKLPNDLFIQSLGFPDSYCRY